MAFGLPAREDRVRNGFRRPDGRGSGQFAESALDTLYVATEADGAGFARRYWLSPNSAKAWPLQGRIVSTPTRSDSDRRC